MVFPPRHEQGGKTSLVIVMPHQRHDFRALERRDQLDKLLKITSRMVMTPDVELCLPRLKLNMNMRMESMLYYMGLNDLFNEVALFAFLLDAFSMSEPI